MPTGHAKSAHTGCRPQALENLGQLMAQAAVFRLEAVRSVSTVRARSSVKGYTIPYISLWRTVRAQVGRAPYTAVGIDN